MSVKFYLYLLVIPFVLIGMDSINLKDIFKKGKVYQARILYLLIALILSYLLVGFIYDFYEVSKII